MEARVINIQWPNNIPSPYGLCLGQADVVRRGPKEIKSQTKSILVTTYTLYSIKHNPHFRKKMITFE